MNSPGVLLLNLGSPDSPSVGDVRRYLRQFLMDRRVIDAPWTVRFGVVHFCILPFRASKAVETYALIGTRLGSPVFVTGRRVRLELQKCLRVPVELARQ